MPKKKPNENKSKGSSRRTDKSKSGRRFEGDIFARITVIGIIRVASIMNAITLVAQLKPMRGCSSWKTVG